jgi:hypothetical protein
MRRGHQGKVDGNHRDVIAVAEAYGWQVVSLASVGGGCPDILCYREPQGYRLIEVKVGKAKFTPAQERFRQKYSMPVLTVRSAEEAESVFGAITKD